MHLQSNQTIIGIVFAKSQPRRLYVVLISYQMKSEYKRERNERERETESETRREHTVERHVSTIRRWIQVRLITSVWVFAFSLLSNPSVPFLARGVFFMGDLEPAGRAGRNPRVQASGHECSHPAADCFYFASRFRSVH